MPQKNKPMDQDGTPTLDELKNSFRKTILPLPSPDMILKMLPKKTTGFTLRPKIYLEPRGTADERTDRHRFSCEFFKRRTCEMS